MILTVIALLGCLLMLAGIALPCKVVLYLGMIITVIASSTRLYYLRAEQTASEPDEHTDVDKPL